MCGKDCGQIHLSLFGQGKGDTRKPFVEVCNDSSILFSRDELRMSVKSGFNSHVLQAYLSQEPCNQITEDNSLIGLMITNRRRNTSSSPKISFPFVQPFVTCSCIDQEDSWGTLDQPSSVHQLNASFLHRSNCIPHRPGRWVQLFHFYRSLARWSDFVEVRGNGVVIPSCG